MVAGKGDDSEGITKRPEHLTETTENYSQVAVQGLYLKKKKKKKTQLATFAWLLEI